MFLDLQFFFNVLYILFVFFSRTKEDFEDTKVVIRIRKSQNRNHNDKKVQKDHKKKRSTKHTHETKDRVTRIPLKTEGELRCSGRVSVPAPLVAPVVLI